MGKKTLYHSSPNQGIFAQFVQIERNNTVLLLMQVCHF